MITREQYERFLLLATAAHSLLTGIGLLLQPRWLIAVGGWRPVTDPFFPAQGGVFHIIMAALYVLAARRRHARALLLPLIVFVKATAAVFLVLYYYIAEQVWLVLVSGILDGVMAVLVYRIGRVPPTRDIRSGEE